MAELQWQHDSLRSQCIVVGHQWVKHCSMEPMELRVFKIAHGPNIGSIVIGPSVLCASMTVKLLSCLFKMCVESPVVWLIHQSIHSHLTIQYGKFIGWKYMLVNAFKGVHKLNHISDIFLLIPIFLLVSIVNFSAFILPLGIWPLYLPNW